MQRFSILVMKWHDVLILFSLVGLVLFLTACPTDSTPPPDNKAPEAPTNVKATAGVDFIDVTWNDSSDNETGFIIHREATVGTTVSTQAFTKIAEVAADVTTYRDSDVETNKSYTYKVAATNTHGSSEEKPQTGDPVTPKESSQVDTTPDAFIFIAEEGVKPSTEITSNTITVKGINAPSPISVSGNATPIINGKVSAANTVNNNDTVAVRVTSSSQPEGSVETKVTIGGVSSTFKVTTEKLNTNDCINNNAFVEACSIELNKAVEGKIEIENDVDYYVFTTPASGVIELDVEPVPSNMRMRATVYDEDQKSLGRFEANSVGGKVSGEVLSKAGKYYIVLSRGNRFSGGDPSSEEIYSFKINLDTTDKYEVNNTFVQAAPVSLNQDIVGTIRPRDDVDYYVFTTPTSGVIELDVEPVPSDMRMRATIYDEDQKSLGRFEARSVGGKVSGDVQALAGRHYIAVSRGNRFSGGEGDSEEPYTLRITFGTN